MSRWPKKNILLIQVIRIGSLVTLAACVYEYKMCHIFTMTNLTQLSFESLRFDFVIKVPGGWTDSATCDKRSRRYVTGGTRGHESSADEPTSRRGAHAPMLRENFNITSTDRLYQSYINKIDVCVPKWCVYRSKNRNRNVTRYVYIQ